jgi:hypothetical protein
VTTIFVSIEVGRRMLHKLQFVNFGPLFTIVFEMQMAAFIGTGILSNPPERLHSMEIESAPHAHHTLQLSTSNTKKHTNAPEATEETQKINHLKRDHSEGSSYRPFKVLCWRKVDDVVRVFDKEFGVPNVSFHHEVYSISDAAFHKIIVYTSSVSYHHSLQVPMQFLQDFLQTRKLELSPVPAARLGSALLRSWRKSVSTADLQILLKGLVDANHLDLGSFGMLVRSLPGISIHANCALVVGKPLATVI